MSSPHRGIVILDFGSPIFEYGNYGSLLWDGTHLTTEDIKSLVQEYYSGFGNGLGNDYQSFITITVGTNNTDNYVTYEHGAHWGQMINDLNTMLINSGYNSQIAIVAGIDMEPDSGSKDESRAWIFGYNSGNNAYPVYNFGHADDCPDYYPPTEPENQTGIIAQQCENFWSQDDINFVSWYGLAYPFPEIYRHNGRNAEQWLRIALYKHFVYGGNMRFDAALGEFRACQQQIDPSACADYDNTAQQALDQLQIYLNQDHYNRIDINLRLSSEKMWYYGDPTP